MLNITVLCVGKLKERFYRDAVEEYRKRLTGLCKLELVELPEVRLPERPAQAQIDAALQKEGAAIRARLPKRTTLIALCIEGREMSSEALAEQLSALAVSGQSSVTFLIGGSYGLDPALKQEAALRLSMSPMTFPHHLARVMLLEQIYRAFQINKGSEYHK
ncbi:MAG: 23S rRNA (pseudouridine(1915)-N(3))-methyltransferase RlmH [Clostridiales bacterium]|nr:23S rRNA (pseudouridine(1915)-N(3))-methyltransferase RlmH [Clostridiales bacterium]